jgi:hypothetical protein
MRKRNKQILKTLLAISLILPLMFIYIPPVQAEMSEPEIIWGQRAVYMVDTYTRQDNNTGSDSWSWTCDVWVNGTRYYAKCIEQSTWYWEMNHTAQVAMVMFDLDQSLMMAIGAGNVEVPIGEPPSEDFFDQMVPHLTDDEGGIEFSVYKEDCFNSWEWNRTVEWYNETMDLVAKPDLSGEPWLDWLDNNTQDSNNHSYSWFGWRFSEHLPLSTSTLEEMVVQEVIWQDGGISLFNDTNGNGFPDCKIDTITYQDNWTNHIVNSTELGYMYVPDDADVIFVDPVVAGNTITFRATFDLTGNWYSMDTNLLHHWAGEGQNATPADVDDYEVVFTVSVEGAALQVKQGLSIDSITAVPEEGLSLAFLQMLQVGTSTINYGMENGASSNSITNDTLEAEECGSWEMTFTNEVMQHCRLDITGNDYQLGNEHYELVGSQVPFYQYEGVWDGSGNDKFGGSNMGTTFMIAVSCPTYDHTQTLQFDPQLWTFFAENGPAWLGFFGRTWGEQMLSIFLVFVLLVALYYFGWMRRRGAKDYLSYTPMGIIVALGVIGFFGKIDLPTVFSTDIISAIPLGMILGIPIFVLAMLATIKMSDWLHTALKFGGIAMAVTLCFYAGAYFGALIL